MLVFDSVAEEKAMSKGILASTTVSCGDKDTYIVYPTTSNFGPLLTSEVQQGYGCTYNHTARPAQKGTMTGLSRSLTVSPIPYVVAARLIHRCSLFSSSH